MLGTYTARLGETTRLRPAEANEMKPVKKRDLVLDGKHFVKRPAWLKCPRCGGRNIRYRVKDDAHVCLYCGCPFKALWGIKTTKSLSTEK